MSTLKRPSLSLYLGTLLKVELTDYCFILKVTRVFPIPTQARDYSFLFVRKKTETWLVLGIAPSAGSPTGVENMGVGEAGLKSKPGGKLKMLLKNTCQGF